MKNIIFIFLPIIAVFVLSVVIFWMQNPDPHYSMEVPCIVMNKTNKELKIDFMITDVFGDNRAYFEKHSLTILPEKMDAFLSPDYETSEKMYAFLYIESEKFTYKLRNLSRYNKIVIYDNPLRVEIEKFKSEDWKYHQSDT